MKTVLLLLLVLVAGCVQLEREYPGRTSYVLDVERQGEPATGSRPAHLQVRRVRVSDRFSGTGFIYRTGELNYETDFYHRFLTSPGTLITEEVRQWIETSGLFGTPAGRQEETPADYVIEGEVTALYGDFRGRPQAVLEIVLSLLDARTARSEVLLRRTYRQEVPLPAESPEGLVQGWNSGLQRTLTQFESDLRQILPR